MFSKFDIVVNACFGQILHENYKICIDEFLMVLEKEKVRYTNKVHVLKFHVPQLIKLKNSSLGTYSEQAVEVVHQGTSWFQKT